MKGFVWTTGDCVIRALANAAGIPWINAYDYLVAKARRDFSVPNDSEGFRKWCIEDGAQWHAVAATRGKDRITAEAFAKTHPKGRFILRLAHHEAACVDGIILDSWNCGWKCVYGYIDMSGFKIPETLCMT